MSDETYSVLTINQSIRDSFEDFLSIKNLFLIYKDRYRTLFLFKNGDKISNIAQIVTILTNRNQDEYYGDYIETYKKYTSLSDIVGVIMDIIRTNMEKLLKNKNETITENMIKHGDEFIKKYKKIRPKFLTRNDESIFCKHNSSIKDILKMVSNSDMG